MDHEIKEVELKKNENGEKKGKRVGLKKEKNSITVGRNTYNELKKNVDACNKKLHGRKINAEDVIKFAVKLLKEEHIIKIQETSFSIRDKVLMECEKHNNKNNMSLSFDEYIALKLKIQ